MKPITESRIIISIICVGIILIGGLAYYTWHNRTATIMRVVDGDTIITDSGTRIRILGIDTPEKGRPNFQEAKSLMENLVLDKKVHLKCWKKDKYGRDLCWVYLMIRDKHKVDVGSEEIKAGYSDFVPPY
jgi:endonuclease YncB( thermonuclease family)